MSSRTFRDLLAEASDLVRRDEPCSARLEAARWIARAGSRPVLLADVAGWHVAANVLTSRGAFARALDLDERSFLADLEARLDREPEWRPSPDPPGQETSLEPLDLRRLPLLLHYPTDGGPYLTAGVWVVRHPVFGRNLSYHRLMLLEPNRGSVRVVEQRGMDQALAAAGGRAEAAILIGAPPHVMLAASLSPAPGVDELELAARLAPVSLCRARTVDLEIPADCELVIEGRFTGERGPEGPFVDITGTLDPQRSQPIFEATAVTCRRQPVYHALLPGGLEHMALMGLPKELDIARQVSRVCRCRDVRMTPGGSAWLHAAIVIEPEHPDDARRALEAAFRAHPSLKHCVAVDPDIDAGDPGQIEWAIATRFQADRDLVVLADQPSSSLDPSALHAAGAKSRGAKMGLDATVKAPPGRRRLFDRLVK